MSDNYLKIAQQTSRMLAESIKALELSPDYLKAAQQTRRILAESVKAFEISPDYLRAVQQASRIMAKAIKPLVSIQPPPFIAIQTGLNQFMKNFIPVIEAISPTFIEMQRQINIFAKAMSPVLIEGEQFVNKMNIELAPILKSIQAYQKINMDFPINIKNWAQSIILSPEINELGDDGDNFNTIIFEEKQEVADAIVEVMEKPLNFQQSVMKWFEIFKNKNPLITKLFLAILSLIFAIIVKTTADIAGAAIKNAVLKEKPTQASQIITNVNINQNITIINEVPYYYEITFIDEETEETIKGWISKRSVKLSDYKEKNIEEKQLEDNSNDSTIEN